MELKYRRRRVVAGLIGVAAVLGLIFLNPASYEIVNFNEILAVSRAQALQKMEVQVAI